MYTASVNHMQYHNDITSCEPLELCSVPGPVHGAGYALSRMQGLLVLQWQPRAGHFIAHSDPVIPQVILPPKQLQIFT